ncbi:NEDD8-conjugating enzyme Ubc12 [Porphyridium purpureum]|uniref:NEDD8-conjugating enzyme Ubc12 n=1 Tax=Porphyridium purpureum TaxID=35688 RepID=A0A5J4YX89_PORPP|nr:NEDD8-conjugating enzyme Ubc12 [Porphyridium purpureum]|eukprot:POR7017..scf209_3
MFTLKRQAKETAERKASGQEGNKQTAGELRVQKDVSALDVPSSMQLEFPNPDDLMLFEVTLAPEEGLYKPGKFKFQIKIPPDYPYSPPKATCLTKVYHPNIDLQGNVCLNILRQDWKPVLTLNAVLYGLQLLFMEPNPDDPLNKDAAELMRNSPSAFRANVYTSLRGGYVAGEYFQKCI